MKHELVLGAALMSGLLLPATNAAARDPYASMMAGESALQGKELKKAIEKAAEYPMGSAENPVRAEFPPGQRAYLNRLRCADGKPPAYSRAGNVGDGPYRNIMDVYDVDCGNAAPGKVSIYMDMYHKGHVEGETVPGFTVTER
ncbi:hypothetical protein [Parasphingorhabdus sp.]|uniref:hypothetical protein n=1 Tax=Parasphingorhabdus sp. TaxID=2709688 RepID=UPI003C7120F9